MHISDVLFEFLFLITSPQSCVLVPLSINTYNIMFESPKFDFLKHFSLCTTLNSLGRCLYRCCTMIWSFFSLRGFLHWLTTSTIIRCTMGKWAYLCWNFATLYSLWQFILEILSQSIKNELSSNRPVLGGINVCIQSCTPLASGVKFSRM